MKIYTSYFGNMRNLPKDIVPIAVSAFVPKGFIGIRLTSLAPTTSLLEKYKRGDGMSFALYQQEYKSLILDAQNADNLIARILRLSQGKDVALLCYEKDPLECHRSILAQWLTQHGYNTTEYGG